MTLHLLCHLNKYDSLFFGTLISVHEYVISPFISLAFQFNRIALVSKMSLLLNSNKFKLKQSGAGNILKLAENLFNRNNGKLALLEP